MELQELRKAIDQADEKLLAAFLERMHLAEEIGRYKDTHGIPVLARSREREILDRVTAASGDLAPYAHRLYTTLFSLSRASQHRRRHTGVGCTIDAGLAAEADLAPLASVAVQGTEGAWSQQAADRLFPQGKLVFFRTFEAVFDAVEAGLCDYGVVPVENSANGSVRAVYELLRTRPLHILRATKLCISQVLLGKPGGKPEELREIHSHEQALGQCSSYLKSLGERVKLVPEVNTAVAAALVAASEDRSLAALASPLCAELYGLSILETRVQNSDNNYTRFLVLGKAPGILPGADRVSLILSLPHRPGALHEVLGMFTAQGVNLLKLESAPIPGEDFAYRFFLDLEADVRDPATAAMLEELERICPYFRFLGAYRE